MYTEDYQLQFHANYFATFDKYRNKFLIGELIWNFADFMTDQGGVLHSMRHCTAAGQYSRIYMRISTHIQLCTIICALIFADFPYSWILHF